MRLLPLRPQLSPRQYPQHEQHAIADREHEQAMHDRVVRQVDRTVQNAQRDVRPRNFHAQRRGARGDVHEQAHDIEQHWQLQQVHVVAVWNAHCWWHLGRLTELEIRRYDLATPAGADARGG